LLGFDVVARYLADIEATVDGFSTYPTVYFRFSAPVDINGTLKARERGPLAGHHDALQPGRAVARLGRDHRSQRVHLQ
jgi:hypothetical protein